MVLKYLFLWVCACCGANWFLISESVAEMFAGGQALQLVLQRPLSRQGH